MKGSMKACRVCGLEQPDYPWGESGAAPTYAICACCGVEFGYEDSTLLGIKKYRENWLRTNGNWWSPEERPPDWALAIQLENIPPQFR